LTDQLKEVIPGRQLYSIDRGTQYTGIGDQKKTSFTGREKQATTLKEDYVFEKLWMDLQATEN